MIIPKDAEVILCNEEKGVWRTNKIIVTNPRPITDEVVIELYIKARLSNKITAQCLQTLLWKNRLKISQYIINIELIKIMLMNLLVNLRIMLKSLKNLIMKNWKKNQR